MAPPTPLLRLTLPRLPTTRGSLSHQLQHRAHLRRTNTTTAKPSPPKPRVLPQPDQFRPPSHPQRLRPASRYTVPLSQPERQRQKIRSYPHMFPSEGTTMHWILTSRYLHASICMATLLLLVLSLPVLDFLRTTPYRDLFPPRSLLWEHPFVWAGRWWEVYQMHTDYVSAQTAERRRQKVEDVRKRSEFRKAHGMDEEGRFGGWTARSDDEVMGPGMREGGEASPIAHGAVGSAASAEADVGNVVERRIENEAETYVDFEGNRQPVAKKKWLGIW